MRMGVFISVRMGLLTLAPTPNFFYHVAEALSTAPHPFAHTTPFANFVGGIRDKVDGASVPPNCHRMDPRAGLVEMVEHVIRNDGVESYCHFCASVL